jgi:TolB-like protein/DNA-binding winged helix-turn-helix (wHTH) protein
MSLPFKGLYRFDEFELNPSKRALARNGKPIAVSPKAFEVLSYLVAHPGRVVTKEELLQAVWPDSFVEESNLAQHISWLRKALGNCSNDIVTVPGRGYQFTAEVRAEPFLESPPAEPTGRVPEQSVTERTPAALEELAATPVTATASRPAILESSPSAMVRSKPWRWRITAMVGAVAVMAAATAYFRIRGSGISLFHPAVSIAVLPFTNLTGDPAKEYLSDGISVEMINGLTRAEGGQLRVIARASSMSYKSTTKTVREIARELGVKYVLEGSVQSEGDHLHVTAQLVRGDDQTYVWADTFDGNASQILEFENRITASILHSLSLALLAGKTPEHAPATYAAHDAYLQGLYSLSQRSRSGFEDALDGFGIAVAEDPDYARAYAGLAVTYNLMGQFNWMEPRQAHSQARAAAEQAIALDANLAEAHAALGFNLWFYEWNSVAAEKELRQAIRLEPTNVDARHWYALMLMTSKRPAEAERQMRTALKLDPKALILRTNLGWLRYTERRYPSAIQEMQSVLKDNPDFLTAHYKLWWVYSVMRDVPHAWKELRAIAHLVLTPENENKIIAVYEKEGYAASLKTLTTSPGGYYSESSVDDARNMSLAGDRAEALKYLGQALKDHEGWLIFVESDPAFDSIRSDPEYSRLMQEFHAASVGPEHRQ